MRCCKRKTLNWTRSLNIYYGYRHCRSDGDGCECFRVQRNTRTGETKMRCMTHFLNNNMKIVISRCTGIATLSVVAGDFRTINEIIADAKRSGTSSRRNLKLDLGLSLR